MNGCLTARGSPAPQTTAYFENLNQHYKMTKVNTPLPQTRRRAHLSTRRAALTETHVSFHWPIIRRLLAWPLSVAMIDDLRR